MFTRLLYICLSVRRRAPLTARCQPQSNSWALASGSNGKHFSVVTLTSGRRLFYECSGFGVSGSNKKLWFRLVSCLLFLYFYFLLLKRAS